MKQSVVRISGWEVGLRKVAMTKTLRAATGLGLVAGKACTEHVVEGRTPLDVVMGDEARARALAGALRELGARAEVMMESPGPRVWCDFNAGLEDGRYGLATLGSSESLAELPDGPSEGLRVVLYTEDPLRDGSNAYLVIDAVLEDLGNEYWAARCVDDVFRHEVRAVDADSFSE